MTEPNIQSYSIKNLVQRRITMGDCNGFESFAGQTQAAELFEGLHPWMRSLKISNPPCVLNEITLTFSIPIEVDDFVSSETELTVTREGNTNSIKVIAWYFVERNQKQVVASIFELTFCHMSKRKELRPLDWKCEDFNYTSPFDLSKPEDWKRILRAVLDNARENANHRAGIVPYVKIYVGQGFNEASDVRLRRGPTDFRTSRSSTVSLGLFQGDYLTLTFHVSVMEASARKEELDKRQRDRILPRYLQVGGNA